MTPEPNGALQAREQLIASETAMAEAYEAWRKAGTTPGECLDRASNDSRKAFAAAWRAALRTSPPVQEERERRRLRELADQIQYSGLDLPWPFEIHDREWLPNVLRKAALRTHTVQPEPVGVEPTVGNLMDWMRTSPPGDWQHRMDATLLAARRNLLTADPPEPQRMEGWTAEEVAAHDRLTARLFTPIADPPKKEDE